MLNRLEFTTGIFSDWNILFGVDDTKNSHKTSVSPPKIHIFIQYSCNVFEGRNVFFVQFLFILARISLTISHMGYMLKCLKSSCVVNNSIHRDMHKFKQSCEKQFPPLESDAYARGVWPGQSPFEPGLCLNCLHLVPEVGNYRRTSATYILR